MKELEKIHNSFAALGESVKELNEKADTIKANHEMDDKMKMEMDYIYRSISNIGNYVYKLEGAMYEYMYQHSKGHLPACKTASQMQKALKAMHMDEDYEVHKPMISVASTKHGLVVNASYKNEQKP